MQSNAAIQGGISLLPSPRSHVAASPCRCGAMAPGDWIAAEHHYSGLVISGADWSCAAHPDGTTASPCPRPFVHFYGDEHR
jgi:hypothetical protein